MSYDEIQYLAGVDAANDHLDHSVLNASDLLAQVLDVEARAFAEENLDQAAYARGFADTMHDFLQDKAS